MGKKYKYTHYDEDKRKNEKKFLFKFRKAVYSILDIPTYRNIIYTNTEIFDLVIECALRHSFIEDMTNRLNRDEKTVCDADTVYYRLKKLDVTEWTERFRKANDTLLKMAQKQKIIGLNPSVCVDTHPVMCYGDKDAFGVRGTKPKKGSSYAFEYMTVCLSQQKEHVTVAALPLEKGRKTWDALKEVVPMVLHYTDVFCWYMDREFYSTPVVNLMEKYNQKYLIPAKRTAPIKKRIEENPAPCVMPYTMKGTYGTADTTLVLVKNKKGEVKAFITNLKVDASQAEHLFELYKNRWTVDTSYRMVGEVRMNTKTLDYRVRWVLFFLSILLMNGYWLFNDVIKAYDHVSLITFAELHVEARHMLNLCTDTDFG